MATRAIPPGSPPRQPLETAVAALNAWVAKQLIETVPIGEPPLADQLGAYEVVFEIIRRLQPFSEKYSYLQFESFTYRNGLAVPRVATPAQMATDKHGYIPPKNDEADEKRCAAIKAFAYDVLRQGFEVVVQQRWARNAPHITVRKP
jgi:hypothetical protein